MADQFAPKEVAAVKATSHGRQIPRGKRREMKKLQNLPWQSLRNIPGITAKTLISQHKSTADRGHHLPRLKASQESRGRNKQKDGDRREVSRVHGDGMDVMSPPHER